MQSQIAKKSVLRLRIEKDTIAESLHGLSHTIVRAIRVVSNQGSVVTRRRGRKPKSAARGSRKDTVGTRRAVSADKKQTKKARIFPRL